MDDDHDGKIGFDEWHRYFQRVIKTGNYTEADVIEEVGDFFLVFCQKNDSSPVIQKKWR